MPKKLTIHDVAKAAGVSYQTVSRALNDKGEISESTKAHVLAVAKELGYSPSIVAASLSTNRTNTLGLLIPDNRQEIFSRLLFAAEGAATELGYNLFVRNTFRDQQRETESIEALWKHRVDGLVIYSSFLNEEQLQHYTERFQHIVLVNTNYTSKNNPNLVTMNIDDFTGAYQATQYLIDQGNQKIIYLGIERPSISSQRRYQGYMAAVTEAGLSDHNSVLKINLDPTKYFEVNQTLISTLSTDYDAVLCHNDWAAMQLIKVFHQKNINPIPDIFGFDGSYASGLSVPGLNSVYIPTDAVGEAAVKTLVSMVKGETLQEHNYSFQPHLVIRENTN